MKVLSLAACHRPSPALLLTYAEHDSLDSKIRKRLMPIRDRTQELESLADQFVHRHPHLQSVPRRTLITLLRVVQLVSTGVSPSKAIRDAESQFQKYEAKGKKKTVSFREGPHDVQHIFSDSEREEESVSKADSPDEEQIEDKDNLMVDFPDEDDGELFNQPDSPSPHEEEEVESLEEDENEFETVLSWNHADDDQDFVF